MREINTTELTKQIARMCIEANLKLSKDVKNRILSAEQTEELPIGKKILGQLKTNMEIAEKEQIPICQDTGMAVIFLEIGQEVQLSGMFLEDAVNEGVRRGYEEGYLRKSVVSDPLLRVNTKEITRPCAKTPFFPGTK